MPTKLVVTDSDKGRVVSLESSRGNTLLMSAPLADKRATAGAIRSIKAILKDSVAVDDRTITQTAKPSRPARIASATKGAKATTAPVAVVGEAPVCTGRARSHAVSCSWVKTSSRGKDAASKAQASSAEPGRAERSFSRSAPTA